MRLDRLAREIAKFGAVGGAGLCWSTCVVFNLLRHTHRSAGRCGPASLATVVAIVFNYVGFRYFTYRDRDKSGRTRELTLFLLFSAIGLVIENGVLYVATYGFGWDSHARRATCSSSSASASRTLFRFWSYRTWVFRALPAQDDGAEPRRPTARAARSAGAPVRPVGSASAGPRPGCTVTGSLGPLRLSVVRGTPSRLLAASRLRNSAKTGGCCWSSSSRPPSASARSRATARPMPGGVAAADGPLEDPRAQVGRHPGALVRDLDHRLVAGDPGTQRDRAAAVHQRVLDQRGQHLGDRARGADGPQSRACRSGRWRGPRCGRPGATPPSAA